MELYHNIGKYKSGCEKFLLLIIEQFRPLINKYNNKFFNEDIESELIITIIETTKKINLEKFDPDIPGAIFNYFAFTLKNTFLDLLRASSKNSEHILLFEDELLNTFEDSNPFTDLESNLEFKNLIHNLNELQKEVLTDIYLKGLSDTDIARKRNVSKQAIGRIKKRALQKIKSEYALYESEVSA